MALPSAYRLKRRRDFSRVYRQGTRISGTYFVVRASHQAKGGNISRLGGSGLGGRSESSRPEATDSAETHSAPHGGTEQPSKIGVAVSLKVSKRAVVRNRIRRQVQAAMQQIMPQLPRGWLILISARSTATECDYWQFLRELEELLTRAEVIHGHSGRSVL